MGIIVSKQLGLIGEYDYEHVSMDNYVYTIYMYRWVCLGFTSNMCRM